MSNWQPIETAPKDGTMIIAWGPDFNDPISIVWQDTRGGNWRIGGCSSLELGSHGQPTIWTPTPELPTNLVRHE